MFNKDFYPTPSNVVLKMIAGLNFNGSVVYDPQAGKCDIVNVICEHHKPKAFLATEIEPELQAIINENPNVQLIGGDFFEMKAEDISHVDFIIMNPPFSNGVKHIMHAWKIAPPGCTIVSLLNYSNIIKDRVLERKIMNQVIAEHGSKEDIGDVFVGAERKTKVRTAMIKLKKPGSKPDMEFEGYFDLDEEYEHFGTAFGIMDFNYVLAVVMRYTAAVQAYDEVIEAEAKINNLTAGFHFENRITFGAHKANKNSHMTITREVFKKETQKAAWKYLFAEMNMKKYLTSNAIAEINKLIETQQNVPFTRNNIHKMIQMLVGTQDDRMKKMLIEIFDHLTDHHHDNRKNLKGYKTNSAYFVNKKFILPLSSVSRGIYNQPEIKYSSTGDKIDEMVKALCHINGRNYDDFVELYDFFKGVEVPNEDYIEAIDAFVEYTGFKRNRCEYIHDYIIRDRNAKYGMQKINMTDEQCQKVFDFYEANPKYKLSDYRKEKRTVYKEWGKWLDWNDFFEIRVYKNSNIHARFKNDEVWERFNMLCAKAKGWRLPENVGSDVRRKPRKKQTTETGLAVIK